MARVADISAVHECVALSQAGGGTCDTSVKPHSKTTNTTLHGRTQCKGSQHSSKVLYMVHFTQFEPSVEAPKSN